MAQWDHTQSESTVHGQFTPTLPSHTASPSILPVQECGGQQGMSSFTIEVPRSTWMCLLLGLTPRHCHCCLLSSSSFVSLLPMQRRCCPPSAFVYLPLTIPSPLSLSGPCLYPLPCLFVFHSQSCTFAPNINIPPFDIRHSIFSLPAKRIVLSTHPSRSSCSRPLMTPKNTNIFPFPFLISLSL